MASPASVARPPQSNLARALAEHNKTRKATSTSPPNAHEETAGSPPRQSARGADINAHRDSSLEDVRTGSSDDAMAQVKQQATSPGHAEAKRVLIEAQRVTATKQQRSHLSSRKVLATSPPSRRLQNATVGDSHRKQVSRKALPSADGVSGSRTGFISSLSTQASAAHMREQRVALIAAKRQAANEDEYQRKKSAYDKYREAHGLTGNAQDEHSTKLKEVMEAARAKGNIKYEIQKSSGTHKRKASMSGSNDLSDGGHTRIRRSPPSRRATAPLPKLTDSTEAPIQATLTECVSRMGVSERRHKATSSMSALSALSSTNPSFQQIAENTAATTAKARRFFGLI